MTGTTITNGGAGFSDQPEASPAAARALAIRLKTQIRLLGGLFMRSPRARASAAALGLRDAPYYFAGRGGVLGDMDTDAVATLFPFFPAECVHANWQAARDRQPPGDVAAQFTEVCRAWGRESLGDWAGAGLLADLLEAVADAAPAAGLPLFAAWRAVALPADPAARAVQLALVLREHRGGHHAAAVLASRMDPVHAILARDGGSRRAEFMAWPEPYPEVTPELLRRRAAVEELTDDLAAPAYAVLDDSEACELTVLLDRAFRLAVPGGCQ